MKTKYDSAIKMLKTNFISLDERTDGIDMDFARMKEQIEEAMEKMENHGKPKEESEIENNS